MPIIGTGQLALYDLNDVTSSPTKPLNPVEDMVWMDTSKSPYRFMIYKTAVGDFVPTGATSLAQLDPPAAQQVEDAYNAVTDLDSDGKLTRYERSVVRAEIAVITGQYLAATTTSMPTLSSLDASTGTGQVNATRKQSRDLGLPTTDATYVRFGNAYNALRTYLSGLSIKPWNTTSTATLTIVSATWDAAWNEYYTAYQFLTITNNQRAQQYADASADNAKNAAVLAAKEYADDMKELIDGDFVELGGKLTNLEGYIGEAFTDGIIEAAEAKAIEKYKNTVASEKADVDARYTSIYGDSNLAGTPKTNLFNAKAALNTAHTALFNSINTAIADGKSTAAEATDVNSKFTAYNSAMGTLATRFEEAVTSISNSKDFTVKTDAATDAQNKADAAKKHAEDQIKLLDINDRNLLVNNKALVMVSNNNSTYPIERSELDGYQRVRRAFRADNTSSVLSTYTMFFFPVEAGNHYTYSLEVNPEADVTLNLGLSGPSKLCPAGKWTRLEFTTYYTSTASTLRFFGLSGSGFTTEFNPWISHRNAKAQKGTKATDWTPAFEDIQAEAERLAGAAQTAATEYINGLKITIDKEIKDVGDALVDLDDHIETTFKDGVIAEVEAKSIGVYINLLQSEKGDIENRYTALYTDTDLAGTPKTNLFNIMSDYVTAHTNLINAINTAIADGKTTLAEKTNVDSRFATYRTVVAALSTRMEGAVNAIAQAKANRAQSGGEAAATQARKDAIAAVSNASQHALAPITNPTNITAPIATIALPEFEGKHTDGWEVDGRNLLYGSDEQLVSSSYRLKEYKLTQQPAEGETMTLSIKGQLGAGKTSFGIYNSGGSVSMVSLTPATQGPDGVYRVTFGWRITVGSVTAANTDLFVYHMSNSVTVDSTIEWIKLERGSVTAPVYSKAPEETFPSSGNRIQPIASPIFRSGTSMEMLVNAYGDGTTNDIVEWDSFGNAVRIKRWEEQLLDGSLNWVSETKYTNSRRVTVSNLASSLPVLGSLESVKYDGNMLNSVSSGATDIDKALLLASNVLYIVIGNSDSGWGDSYNPSTEDIKAYFNGWKMCNGTIGALYPGTGTKTWHPIKDTDLSRAVTTVPDTVSPAITDKTINHYQVVYRLADPVQEVINFNGILSLIQGENAVAVSYQPKTPAIVKGNIKYATTVATATQDLSYLIPTLQTRLSSAEEIITDDSIVNKVMNSVSYKIGIAGKANAEDLSKYAPADVVDTLKTDVGTLANAVSTIDFTPYVTKSELAQTATQITAKFSATGGMNLVRNSIGFSDLDFWTSVYGNTVNTISNNELDTLGFGSGFVYEGTGSFQGIAQTVSVNPGQPYTLSWYLKKLTAGTTSAHRFFIQILENDIVTAQIADNSSLITTGYESQYITHIPESAAITIRFIGYGSVEATLTGIMLTIGDVPLQWSLGTGELYNTNIRMDINGIRVSQFVGTDGDREEIGYTAITPQEFAGYALVKGVFKKIFYLNGEETVTKKLRVEDEISLGTVKMVKVNSAGNNGMAFIKNSKVYTTP